MPAHGHACPGFRLAMISRQLMGNGGDEIDQRMRPRRPRGALAPQRRLRWLVEHDMSQRPHADEPVEQRIERAQQPRLVGPRRTGASLAKQLLISETPLHA